LNSTAGQLQQVFFPLWQEFEPVIGKPQNERKQSEN
jgi:hypothetical protein